ncbi:DUF4870 domain-containing protein [Candidatus Micrarchaeota archaeon]|nr:DUF4870 domain-containing protein [Candidatus Micrarchaeota archaeon]
MVDRRSIQISVLAHASILIGFFFRYSFIFPLLIWKTLKHSKYSERQARQATYYQVFVLLILLVIQFGAEFLMLLQPLSDGRVPKVDDVLVNVVELAVYAILTIYALYGAYRCSRGADFDYLIIGSL